MTVVVECDIKPLCNSIVCISNIQSYICIYYSVSKNTGGEHVVMHVLLHVHILMTVIILIVMINRHPSGIYGQTNI